MDSETKEEIHPVSKVENLLGTRIEFPNKDRILVDANTLGASQWKEMVDTTQTDFKERGLIVSRKRSGKLVKSEIFISEEEDPQKSITTNVPHELKSLLLGRSMIFVHTHPMPPKVDHLRTTAFSDADLQTFLKGNYNALVMLDRGGAHLLVPTSRYAGQSTSLDNDLVSNTVKSIKERSGGTLDVVKEVAEKLAALGLGYFYTPELDQASNSIKFHNPKNL